MLLCALPLGIVASAGYAQDWHYSEQVMSTELIVRTFYDCAVDRPISVTAAATSASAFGESCNPNFGDNYEFEISPEPGMEDQSPWASAANSEAGLYSCPDASACTIAYAYADVQLGLGDAPGYADQSTISVHAGRMDSRITGCPGCNPSGKGQMAASWVAAWPTVCAGGIARIAVEMDIDVDPDNDSGPCFVRLGEPGESPDPIRTDTFTGFTATFKDVNGDVIGSDTYQGVAFSGMGESSFVMGNIFGLENGPPRTPDGRIEWGGPPCPVGEVCFGAEIDLDYNFELAVPAGTAWVEFDGESVTIQGDRFDINEDGVVNYWDRPVLAASVGYSVNQLGYELHADVDRNGYVNANDLALLDAQPCIADTNGDGSVDFVDLSLYLQWYNAVDLSADLNGDGSLDFIDISAFIGMYASGC